MVLWIRNHNEVRCVVWWVHTVYGGRVLIVVLINEVLDLVVVIVVVVVVVGVVGVVVVGQWLLLGC